MSQTSSLPSGVDGSAPFELHYFPPDPDLAEMVSSFYFARVNMPRFDEYERADRPYIEAERSEEHTSELQSLMRISYAVFCLKKKNKTRYNTANKRTLTNMHKAT